MAQCGSSQCTGLPSSGHTPLCCGSLEAAEKEQQAWDPRVQAGPAGGSVAVGRGQPVAARDGELAAVEPPMAARCGVRSRTLEQCSSGETRWRRPAGCHCLRYVPCWEVGASLEGHA